MYKKTDRLRYWLLLMAFPMIVKAEPAPSIEFWQYLTEFSDEQGEFVDPEDLAVIEKMNDADVPTKNTATSSAIIMKDSSSVNSMNQERSEANL